MVKIFHAGCSSFVHLPQEPKPLHSYDIHLSTDLYKAIHCHIVHGNEDVTMPGCVRSPGEKPKSLLKKMKIPCP